MKIKKFRKIDWFYAISAYFTAFLLVGFIFNSMTVVMSWSISIFIILYLAYWMFRYYRDMRDAFYIDMEIFRKKYKEKND